MATRRFDINTEPHVAEIGAVKLLFLPEATSEDMLAAWATLAGDDGDDVEDLKPENASKMPVDQVVAKASRSTAMLRTFIASLLFDDESREAFADLKLPDRVLLDLQRWLLETYGLRPTGSSSDSSESPPTTASGAPSSTDGSTEASTP